MQSSFFSRLEFAAKAGLYLVAALLPLWFMPGLQAIDFGREITFSILALLIFILWLVSILVSGEIRYRHSPLLIAGAALLCIFGASTFFSRAPFASLLFTDAVAERFSVLVFGLLLVLLCGAVLRTKKDAGRLLLTLIFSSALFTLPWVIQLFFNVSLFRFITPFPPSQDFNVVGTANAFALFLATLLLVVLGLLFSSMMRDAHRIIRYLLVAAAALFLLALLLVNFRTSWVVLVGSGIFFLGLLLKDSRRSIQFRREDAVMRASRPRGLHLPAILVMVFLAFSIVMIMVRTPIFGGMALPAEISPNVRTTFEIARSVFREGSKSTLLGSGPGTFGLDWSLYKNPSFNLPALIGGNRVDLWGARFTQGFSFVSTVVATGGVLGFLSLLVFLGAAIFLFLARLLIAREEEMAYASSAFLGFMGTTLSLFLYPANLSLLLLWFLTMGVSTVLLSREAEVGVEEEYAAVPAAPSSGGAGEQRKWHDRFRLSRGFSRSWEITDRRIEFTQPWMVFLSSLIAIFFLSLSVGGLYMEAGRLRAAYVMQRGTTVLSEGKVDEAMSLFERASEIESNYFRSYHALTQAQIEGIRQLVQRAAQGENVQQEFFNAVSRAQQSAQRAIELNRNEPLVWRTQGMLYELIIPFVQGAERFAFDSYRRATELDPLNPQVWVELGRTALTFADRLQLMFNQVKGSERDQVAQARIVALQEAGRAFEKAVQVKPDFAPAHFLLSQTAIRAGDLAAAIRSTENAKVVAPLDVGVAFQLGLLYYQAGDLDRAQGEFERAVSMNTNYSNARYFLGLIYDRKGDEGRAIPQFEEIEKLNPDNAEVKKILQNLRAGKDALDGIVPPAQPPEKRSDTPVRVREGERPKPQR